MPYLYHRVPDNLQGTELYPLNRLREVDEPAYGQHARKYIGREPLMLETIPIFGNCLWNDVLFLTAVHPVEFRKAYESSGHSFSRPYRVFEFESALLDQDRLAVIPEMQVDQPGHYEHFDASRYSEYARIPGETLLYWKEQKRLGRRPLLFMHIPHILYHGTLDTLMASIVEA